MMKPKKKKLKYRPLKNKRKDKSKSPNNSNVYMSNRNVGQYGKKKGRDEERKRRKSKSVTKVRTHTPEVKKKSNKYVLKDKDFYKIIKEKRNPNEIRPLFAKSRKSVSTNKQRKKKSDNKDTSKKKKKSKKNVNNKKDTRNKSKSKRDHSKSVKGKSFISHCKKSQRSISRGPFEQEYDTLVRDQSNYDTRKSKMIGMIRKPTRSKSRTKKYRTEQDELVFKPLLSKKSLQIAKKLGSSRNRLLGKSTATEADVFEAKHQQDMALRRSATPKINKKSQYLDKRIRGDGSRFERLYKYQDKYRDNKEQLRIKKIDEEMQKELLVSNRPKTPVKDYKPSYYVADVDIADRSSMWKSKKKEKLRKLKDQREEEELKTCTFSPHINKKLPDFNSSNIGDTVYGSEFVKEGLYNHFNRIERARKGKSYQELGRSKSRTNKSKSRTKKRKKVEESRREDSEDRREGGGYGSEYNGYGWIRDNGISQTTPLHYPSNSRMTEEEGYAVEEEEIEEVDLEAELDNNGNEKEKSLINILDNLKKMTKYV